MEDDKTTVRKCPFGAEARHCRHQETRAKDLLSAMRGELVFLCGLDSLGSCPHMKEFLKPVMEDTNDTS